MKLQGSRGSPSRYGWIRQAVELLRRSKRVKRASQHQGLISSFADSASDVHPRRTSKKQGLRSTAADEMRLHFTALHINSPPPPTAGVEAAGPLLSLIYALSQLILDQRNYTSLLCLCKLVILPIEAARWRIAWLLQLNRINPPQVLTEASAIDCLTSTATTSIAIHDASCLTLSDASPRIKKQEKQK